jgi:hypothetical protein
MQSIGLRITELETNTEFYRLFRPSIRAWKRRPNSTPTPPGLSSRGLQFGASHLRIDLETIGTPIPTYRFVLLVKTLVREEYARLCLPHRRCWPVSSLPSSSHPRTIPIPIPSISDALGPAVAHPHRLRPLPVRQS